MADLSGDARLTCPGCRSQLGVVETASGGKTIFVIGLDVSVASTAKALQRFIAPHEGADIICPACDRPIDPSAPHHTHDRTTAGRH